MRAAAFECMALSGRQSPVAGRSTGETNEFVCIVGRSARTPTSPHWSCSLGRRQRRKSIGHRAAAKIQAELGAKPRSGLHCNPMKRFDPFGLQSSSLLRSCGCHELRPKWNDRKRAQANNSGHLSRRSSREEEFILTSLGAGRFAYEPMRCLFQRAALRLEERDFYLLGPPNTRSPKDHSSASLTLAQMARANNKTSQHHNNDINNAANNNETCSRVWPNELDATYGNRIGCLS